MAVTENWTDPDSLDRATGEVLTEVIWDGVVSNLAYIAGQTATGVVDSKRIGLPVDNSTGGTLTAGTLVYISGYDASTGAPQITKADADSRQAEYVLNADIANGAAGVVYRGYTLGSLDTSGSSVGDPIYLSATAGSWSASALTGAAQISQKVGVVVTSHASTGSIQFLLPGEILKWGSGNLQSKSVAVAALADGVDGELITWSASAVADTVAAGTATHVLTSNGAGAAPTFQAAAGGGKIDQVSFTAGASGAITSTSFVDVSGGEVDITTDKGGLMAWYFLSGYQSDTSANNYIALQLDSDGEVAQSQVTQNLANQDYVYSGFYSWSSVSNAAHEINVRAKVSGGTFTLRGGAILVFEWDD